MAALHKHPAHTAGSKWKCGNVSSEDITADFRRVSVHMHASISITVGLGTHIKRFFHFCLNKKTLYAACPPAILTSSLAPQLWSQVLGQMFTLYKLRGWDAFSQALLVAFHCCFSFFLLDFTVCQKRSMGSDRVFLGHLPGLKMGLSLAWEWQTKH